MVVPNVLAERYATAEMRAIFDAENRIVTERRLWIAVMRAQAALGLDIPEADIERYERVVDHVDLESIERRERVTKHDVKARIDEFSALAGRQHAHKGMTSRDLTENVEALLSLQAARLIHDKTVALLARWCERAVEHASLVVVGRTHNVPAQPTTMGKRFAQYCEELLNARRNLEQVIDAWAIRGMKGPVGSQQDQLDLLGDPTAVAELETRVSRELGVPSVLGAVAQVTPRSRDFEMVAALMQVASAPANFALQVRLMAGLDLATEGFAPGQVGSSAMPHKMNSRTCERINGFHLLMRGYVTMAAGLTGDQWNEGDVSCSVVRRVLIPDSFMAMDGLLEAALSVTAGVGFFEPVIDAEVRKYLPFVSTPTLLMHAVTNGAGREEAHEAIKHAAVTAALAMREGEGSGEQMIDALGMDPSFPGDTEELRAIASDPTALLGRIDSQIGAVVADVAAVVERHPGAAGYTGSPVL